MVMRMITLMPDWKNANAVRWTAERYCSDFPCVSLILYFIYLVERNTAHSYEKKNEIRSQFHVQQSQRFHGPKSHWITHRRSSTIPWKISRPRQHLGEIANLHKSGNKILLSPKVRLFLPTAVARPLCQADSNILVSSCYIYSTSESNWNGMAVNALTNISVSFHMGWSNGMPWLHWIHNFEIGKTIFHPPRSDECVSIADQLSLDALGNSKQNYMASMSWDPRECPRNLKNCFHNVFDSEVNVNLKLSEGGVGANIFDPTQ